ILPLGTELDKIDATLARADTADLWDAAALTALDRHLETEPFLIRISAAKRLRDRAEREARRDGSSRVTIAHLESALREREPA
ncbi:MAG: chlorophyllide a reductase subunit Z, partial [Acidiphilium sp.]